MLCNMKMSFMLGFWHRNVGPGPLCSWLEEFWGGSGEVGGCGGRAAITFLIVRSWWFIWMKWHTCGYAVHSLWYMSWYFCCYALDVSCTWSDISADTLFILGASSISLISAIRGPGKSFRGDTWYICTLVYFGNVWDIVSSHNSKNFWPRNWKMEYGRVKKSVLGDDGAHNSLQIPLIVCFGRRPHGICGPFSNYRCSQNTARVQKSTARCWKCSFCIISSGASSPRATMFLPQLQRFPAVETNQVPEGWHKFAGWQGYLIFYILDDKTWFLCQLEQPGETSSTSNSGN